MDTSKAVGVLAGLAGGLVVGCALAACWGSAPELCRTNQDCPPGDHCQQKVCNPVQAGSHGLSQGGSGAGTSSSLGSHSSSGSGAVSFAGSGASSGPSSPAALAVEGAACTTVGQRACAGVAQDVQLGCGANRVWTFEGACLSGYNCVTWVGPLQGTCMPIAPECVGQPAGAQFCAQDTPTQSTCGADQVAIGVVECPSGVCRAGACQCSREFEGDGFTCTVRTLRQLPPLHPVAYTVQEQTVEDNVTGLLWQRHVAPETWDQAHAAAVCESLTLDNQTGWRLPSIRELASLVDYTTFGPAINVDAFPDEVHRLILTSSTLNAGDPTQAFALFQDTGEIQVQHRLDMMGVRCVNGLDWYGAPAQLSVAGDRVLDSRTGLMWQQQVVPDNLVWLDALAVCQAGWRLPTIRELESVVDYSHAQPAANPGAFPFVTLDLHWTSTPASTRANSFWTVDFGVGVQRMEGFTGPHTARCVQ